MKVLKFLKPFWGLVAISILLSFLYILFNSMSLWISVDFMQELFNPQEVSQALKESGKNVSEDEISSIDATEIGALPTVPGDQSLYQDIRLSIKKLIVRENRYDTLLMVCLIVFFSFLFKNIVGYIRRVLLHYIELNVVNNIRNELDRSLLRLPISFFERTNTGEITSIVFNDVNAINIMLYNSFGRMILSPLQVLTNLAILVLISWQLSLITFAIIPFIAFVITIIGQSIRRKSRRVFKQIAEVVHIFQESVSGIRIVKAFVNEKKEEARFQGATQKWFRENFRAHRLKEATSPINETFVVLALSVLLWVGGQMVYTGNGLTAEDFMRYLLFLVTIFTPLKDFSSINNVIQTGMAASERVFTILDYPTEVYESPGAKPMAAFTDRIVFDKVRFRYSDDLPEVLKDISLDIQKGQTVAFVGPSGAGKSTLVDLVPRFYDVTAGSIRIDGVDIREVTLTSLREQIGIVTQESILFNDTIRNNIGYGVKNPTEEDIINAAKVANAWEFIEKTDEGLDTITGERGIKLSGGQKQRLSIARAILNNPPILILDEATSALDTESEKLVQEALYNLMKNRTTLVIAHRLSTVTHADKIVVLDSGKVVGIGKHEELLVSTPQYKKLYELQFRNELT